MKKAFLIAAASSGSGKTTITIGLLRALRNKGYKVQPFKCGPDYIDPLYHHIACETDSVNLDTWMQPTQDVRKAFQRYGQDADICIAEGVMGLFDGADGIRGSSAEVAELLGIPVILVINARSMAHSIAPILQGYLTYRPTTKIAGVIFNNVGSPRHEQILLQAAKEVGMPVIGAIPRLSELYVPSRHLGLDISETEKISQLAERVAEVIEPEILDSILNLPSPTFNFQFPTFNSSPKARRIFIAHDAAFNFLYRQTIDYLREQGEVHFFSPLANETVPQDTDLVYIPGGYPEFFVQQLSQSQATMESLRQTKARIWAECGGMMYLSQGIDKTDMAGLLPFRTTMQNARLHLGYRTMMMDGKEFRGHEFHYSSIMGTQPPSDIQLYDAQGQPVETGFYIRNNVYAGYTHWLYPLLP
ncbi:MAG: cobyrinate a,c-diamide synthase [Bacteroidaceae bacterium]|nr:cobyrinate a,c-diamide synthase [Bacteroidaceae bacterium]